MSKRLPFSNRYVFAKVMHDRPDLCKEVVECILGVEVGRIEAIEVESEETSITRRSVRFDVYMQSDDYAFEVEMQTYEQKDLPKRMRFYRSQLDRRMLAKGEAFGGLKPVYVIFICLDDPFDAGRPVYTFKSMCEEDASVPFDNGVLDMVLNASGDLALARPQVADLLKFVKTNRVVEDGTLAARISGAVEDAYRDEEWVSDMSKLEWDIQDARNYAAKEGRAEGLAEGLAEGRAEGLAEGREEGRAEGLAEGIGDERARLDALISAMSESGKTADEILSAIQTHNRDELYKQFNV